MPIKPLSLLVPALLLVACSKPAPAPPAPATSQPAAAEAQAPSVASAWSGRWSGPEATFLDVIQDGPALSVAVTNLDGVRRFDAVEVEGGLAFERDGIRETIKAGNGADTGMKWLADKTQCLVVKAGEGYCRN